MSSIQTYHSPAQSLLKSCDLCCRHCHIDRLSGKTGYCGQSAVLRAARAALHFWEEPCISGKEGSGAVFFSGCSLRCVFCQNHSIAIGQTGKELSVHHLAEIFLRLQEEQHANNINLVTPTHFIPQIADALTEAKKNGLILPVVYNTGSYETVSALSMLDGLVDIYLPDLKYNSPALSVRYANTSDYFECACLALAEMYRQVGTPQFHVRPDSTKAVFQSAPGDQTLSDLSETALLSRGMIVRHLLLPGHAEDSIRIIRYLAQTYQDRVFLSIMNQYTPMSGLDAYPELQRTVTDAEYDTVIDEILSLGLENVFIQEGSTAEESFIPPFDCEGL